MKKIFIDYAPDCVRYALTDGGALVEVVAEHTHNESILGNVYAGVVQTVLYGGFAFIDIGMGRSVFINLSDYKEKDSSIKKGHELLVQVVREAGGNKVANATTQLSLTGRFAALYLSKKREIGVSKKISSAAEKKRLYDIADAYLPEGFGVTVRTASEERSEAEIAREINKLAERFERIDAARVYAKVPALLHSENTALRDLLSDGVTEIAVSDASQLAYVRQTADDIMYGYKGTVEPHTGPLPLFEQYGIEAAIAKALEKQVSLKSGGFLYIEQTEACAVIDVNSGKSSGKLSSGEMALRINTEAAREIARQLRLRNLSGIIIIDFINMRGDGEQEALRRSFAEELKKDRLGVSIAGMTELGLMQLTRKKTREPLGLLLQRPCPHCNGSGMVRKR